MAIVTSRGLALLTGQRWSLAIVAALGAVPQRFSALRTAILGLSADLLTRRLAVLGDADVLKSIVLPPLTSVAAYTLTARSDQLGPIGAELERLATQFRSHSANAERTSQEPQSGAHP